MIETGPRQQNNLECDLTKYKQNVFCSSCLAHVHNNRSTTIFYTDIVLVYGILLWMTPVQEKYVGT